MDNSAEHIRIYDNQPLEEEFRPIEILEAIPEDSVRMYMNQAGTHPILTKQEEVELAQRMELGQEAEQQLAKQQPHRFSKRWEQLNQQIEEGAAARQHFIGCNLKLVISIAKKYKSQGLPLGDLINEGNLGLMRGVEHFDWRRGFKFSTYGTWWIRQAITRAIADTGRAIRLPVHMVEKLRAAKKESREFAIKFGREPTKKEFAELADIPPEKVDDFKQYDQFIRSLDEPMSLDSGEDVSLLEVIAGSDDTEAESLRQIEIKELGAALESRFDSLSERERQAIKLRFGLIDGKSHTLKQIGEVLDFTPETARNVLNETMRKLRDSPGAALYRYLLESHGGAQ